MPKIIIYSTPTCVYCKMAKQFLASRNIPYEEMNVAEDMKAREDMVNKSHQLGVPVIDVDGKIFVGFDREGLAEALHIKE